MPLSVGCNACSRVSDGSVFSYEQNVPSSVLGSRAGLPGFDDHAWPSLPRCLRYSLSSNTTTTHTNTTTTTAPHTITLFIVTTSFDQDRHYLPPHRHPHQLRYHHPVLLQWPHRHRGEGSTLSFLPHFDHWTALRHRHAEEATKHRGSEDHHADLKGAPQGSGKPGKPEACALHALLVIL